MGRAFRIDFEDVFVRAEVMYQTRQSACKPNQSLSWALGLHFLGKRGSTYNELVGHWCPECLGYLLGVGTHAAVACSD